MTLTQTVTPSTVLDAVTEIVPRLRENGPRSEENRWIVQENVDLLEQAGVFRLAVPRRYGGLDRPLSEQVRVLTEIARGCGSTSWASVAWVSSAWMATLFPPEVQDEIFARGTVRISGAFTPTATARPVDGGYRVSGSWRFNTGCLSADWDLVAIMVLHADGTEEEVFALVPMDELAIADDWHVSAASATGSSTTTANDLFVPQSHVVTGEAALTTGPQGDDVTPGRGYSLITYVVAASVATYIGMAQAALELFLERLPGRGLAYTLWEDQRQHPLTQHRVAVAANKITAAEHLSAAYVALLQERADAGVHPSDEEKAQVRGQAGYAIQLVKEAVEELHSIAGASALSKRSDFQRFHRDLLGLSLHGLMSPDMSLETHGRVLVGLDAGTPFL